MPVSCGLASILRVHIALLSFATAPAHSAPALGSESGTPFGMRFPPLEQVCDYPVVTFWRRNLVDSRGRFDLSVLDQAQACGTRVVLRLNGFTRDILEDDGRGLDLAKYEDRINDFAGWIDPYVQDGTLLAHVTIDEPHDCYDWGGQCPTPWEVDQAGLISKRYWPALLTIVNTMPRYASQYDWEYTDIANFQYAFHKGPLDEFIHSGLEVKRAGRVANISWSFQARWGGCRRFGECSMTPAQVEEVARALCGTRTGQWVSFSSYDARLVTVPMQQAIDRVRSYGGGC